MNYLFLILIIFLMLFIDQWVKADWAAEKIDIGVSFRLIALALLIFWDVVAMFILRWMH